MRVAGISAILVCLGIGAGIETGCVGSTDEAVEGTLSVNLVGQGQTGAIYRLRNAIITVQGPANAVFNTEDNPDQTSLSANVVIGDYVALVQPGWRVERVEGVITTPVTATLISANPASFTVQPDARTTVPLRFRVDANEVDMSQGYDIVLEIDDAPAQMLVAINDTNGHLERIDPDTLAVTDIGPLGVPYAFGDCMWNPADATLYMVDGRGAFGLYKVNLTTGAATLVGTHGVSAMEAIAYHPPTNKVYGLAIDPPTSFYTISTVTGAATAIGPVAGRFQAMAWDSKRNMMVGYDGSVVFSIDVATGGMMPLGAPIALLNYGMTYDPALDRFWVVDSDGQIFQLDPNEGYTLSRAGAVTGAHTCVASVPRTP